jgi:hypothetical protein
MTKLLEKVLEQAEKLPLELQEELAEQFIEDIENELRWQETLSKPQSKLTALGDMALKRSMEGRSKKMGFDEL